MNLSHDNPCFQCRIAITNFLVSHTCDIRFHDVIGQSTVHMYSKTWLIYMAKLVCIGPLSFNLIRWIQICDKKNLTFVDCCDKIFIKLALKNVIKLAKGSLNPFPNKPWFLRVYSIIYLKTLWEKEKLLVTSHFSFSHSVFYPFWTTFFHFHQFQNCRLQTLSVWKSQKFAVWERVNNIFQDSFNKILSQQVTPDRSYTLLLPRILTAQWRV